MSNIRKTTPPMTPPAMAPTLIVEAEEVVKLLVVLPDDIDTAAAVEYDAVGSDWSGAGVVDDGVLDDGVVDNGVVDGGVVGDGVVDDGVVDDGIVVLPVSVEDGVEYEEEEGEEVPEGSVVPEV